MATVNVVRKDSYRVRDGMKFYFDYWLLLAVSALVIVGMLMVYSTTFDYAFRYIENDSTYFLRRQTWALVIGLAGVVVVMQFDYQSFRKISLPFLLGTIGILAALLFVGESLLGATRGLSGGSYQPSEMAKVAIILYISHWVSSKGDRIKHVTYGLFPFAIILGTVCAFIVLQPDLSTSILIAAVCFAIFFVGGADVKQLAIAGLLGGLVFATLMFTLEHAAARVDAWQIALRDPTQASWHVQQSLISLSAGGWFGVGAGQSVQKFGPLPAAHTDSVFAVIGEEFGFAGCIFVIGLFLILAWRGYLAAINARDSFGFLLAFGITTWLSFQTLINIAVITAVIPFTGIPLPFISYGGSSLVISLIGAGILLNISRDAALGRAQSPRRIQPTGSGSRQQPRSSGSSRPILAELKRGRTGISMRRRDRRTRLPSSRSNE